MTSTSAPRKIGLLSRIVAGSPRAMTRLAEAGTEVLVDLAGYEARERDARWEQALAQMDGLVVGLQPVDRALLDRTPQLTTIVRMGTGMDNIDLDETDRRGIRVTALPGRNAEAVAELAFGLLLAAARGIARSDREIRAGVWQRSTGRHLGGRTLGLIGYGAIAQGMVPKARGFGMEVIVHRRSGAPAGDLASVTLEELIDRSQFISLHVPLTADTRGLIGAAEIDRMRGTVLVNTARGEVVDEAALISGLGAGNVAAAGLDVFASEPLGDSPLLALDNVVLTPHNGSYSDVVVEEVAMAAIDALFSQPK
jgi:glyoxylate reductase